MIALNPYKPLLVGVVILGAVLGIAWGVHAFAESQREVGRAEVRAEAERAEKLATAHARKIETILTTQLLKAETNATTRETALRSVIDSGSKSADRLRGTLEAITNGVPNASADALRATTVTLATVLSSCQAEYRQMAATADRHASDVQTLMEAYPVTPPAEK